MLKKTLKNNLVMTNQIRSKLLLKHLYNNTTLQSSRLSVNFNKLKSFNDDIILEGLFLLEFLSSLKANVTYYKKMYQEVSLQIATILRRTNIYYFIVLLKLFYFPLLIRRNVSLVESFDKTNNYSFTLTSVNSFPFLPDVFFKWNIPINCFLNFDSNSKNDSRLFLQYWNFPVLK